MERLKQKNMFKLQKDVDIIKKKEIMESEMKYKDEIVQRALLSHREDRQTMN
jgi:hypothetical protein